MNIDDLNLSPEELNKKTDEQLLEIVDHEPMIFTKIPTLRRDSTFCLKAIKLNPYILRYVKSPTGNMIDSALKEYPRAMLFVPKPSLTVSRCVKACKQEPMLINAVPSSIIEKVRLRLQFPVLRYLIPHFILRRFMK